MYGIVPYNLSPIQQGIQFGHAIQEYNNMMSSGRCEDLREVFDKWRLEDKTFIILNGGTTNDSLERMGSLNIHNVSLTNAGVQTASFREPDLGDQLTAFVFLVDERVWDREKWPDFKLDSNEKEEYNQMVSNGGEPDLEYFESYRIWFNNFSRKYHEAERIVWLRDFLRNFKLA